MRAGAGKLQVATVGVGRARSPPRRCPRRWCGRCRRPTAARSAPTPPTRCATSRRRPTPSSSARAWPTRRRPQAFGERLLPHLTRPAGARRARPGLRHRRRRLPAPPRRPGGPHARTRPSSPTRCTSTRTRSRTTRPAPRVELAGRARARRRAGRRHVVDRGARRRALAGRERRRRASASPGPATCGPGITGGLLARGADPAQAAVWAAFLHGRGGGAAGVVGRAARLPGPRAAAGDPASARRDHRLTARLRRRTRSRRTACARQLHRGTGLREPRDRRRGLRRADGGRGGRGDDGPAAPASGTAPWPAPTPRRSRSARAPTSRTAAPCTPTPASRWSSARASPSATASSCTAPASTTTCWSAWAAS